MKKIRLFTFIRGESGTKKMFSRIFLKTGKLKKNRENTG